MSQQMEMRGSKEPNDTQTLPQHGGLYMGTLALGVSLLVDKEKGLTFLTWPWKSQRVTSAVRI